MTLSPVAQENLNNILAALDDQMQLGENAAFQAALKYYIVLTCLGGTGGGGGSIDISTLAKEDTLQSVQSLIGALSSPATGTVLKTLIDIVTRLGTLDATETGTIIHRLEGISDYLATLVSGTTGTVEVSNFPTTQTVNGTVSVSNFPASQTVNGVVLIGNLPATQPVSAVSLPLPSGAATATNQSTANIYLSGIDGKLPALSGGRIPVEVSGGSSGGSSPATALYWGRKTVATSGTNEAIAASQTLVKSVTIQALPTNTGLIYVGGSGVNSTTGFPLSPGQSTPPLEVNNLNLVFISPSVNAEGINYIAC